MRIVLLEIKGYRGIREMTWAPDRGINCLIGPGDSTKTTILDAIEFALTPRSNAVADDSDFYGSVVGEDSEVSIVVTLTGLPPEFLADNTYGLELRGWDEATCAVVDEMGQGLEEALSIRVTIDNALEPRWTIYNDRVKDADDPPSLRFKDAKQLLPARIGPYAERHLGWGRNSVLVKLGQKDADLNLRLAEASRAARAAFKEGQSKPFKATAERAQKVGTKMAVPVRDVYNAQLDVQGMSMSSGAIALHDGPLSLRRLGTGSSRLLVAALQNEASAGHIALIDEVEHGLEPHRIIRLLKFLNGGASKVAPQQVFMTSHSPVVVLELAANQQFRVLSTNGITTVQRLDSGAASLDEAQRNVRADPDVFLARRIVIGEGRTEQGLIRGLERHWESSGSTSLAEVGAIAADGRGNPQAISYGLHLASLGYSVYLMMDSDKDLPSDAERLKSLGAKIYVYPGKCCTEERIFLDMPWPFVSRLLLAAQEFEPEGSVGDCLNSALEKAGREERVTALDSIPDTLNCEAARRLLGSTAHKREWFKGMREGERLGGLIAEAWSQLKGTPLKAGLEHVRAWLDSAC